MGHFPRGIYSESGDQDELNGIPLKNCPILVNNQALVFLQQWLQKFHFLNLLATFHKSSSIFCPIIVNV